MIKMSLKNMKGWNIKPEIFHEDKAHESKKAVQNIFSYSSPSL